MNTQNIEKAKIYIVSRPLARINSLQLVTINTYTLLRLCYGKRSDVELIELGKYLSKFVPPFGSALSPLMYDYITPFLDALRHFRLLMSDREYIIIHMMYPSISLYALTLQQLMPVMNMYNSSKIRSVVTIHHIPEYISPEYILEKLQLDKLCFGSIDVEEAVALYMKSPNETLQERIFYIHDVFSHLLALHDINDINIVAASTLTKLEIKRILGKRAGNNIYVVNPGFWHHIANEIIKAKEKSLAKSNHSKYLIVGYLGALVSRKNPLLLPLIIYMLNRGYYRLQGKKALLFIQGSGPLSKVLIELASRLDVMDYVKISKKSLSEREKYSFLSSLDVLVFPSIKEGFGLPIVESVAVNTPCIVFSWSKIPPEVKKLCISVRDVEELLQVLCEFTSSKDFREEILARIKEVKNKLKSYSWLAYIKKLTRVYNSILRTG